MLHATGGLGLLLSQFWPDAPPNKHNFLMRNATMSETASTTIVVEAGEPGGARAQARMAVEHGRSVIWTDLVVNSTEWGAAFVGRPGVTVASSMDEVTAAVERSAHRRTASTPFWAISSRPDGARSELDELKDFLVAHGGGFYVAVYAGNAGYKRPETGKAMVFTYDDDRTTCSATPEQSPAPVPSKSWRSRAHHRTRDIGVSANPDNLGMRSVCGMTELEANWGQ